MLPLRLLLTAALTLASSSLHAENWPTWRGPTADGICTETSVPRTWSATENILWKADLPERGNSTPIVWGDQVFLTQSVGSRRTVMSLSATDGHLLWQAGPEWKEPEQTHQTNPFASGSPVTDGERVIAWLGSAGLWCWDLAGKEQWHVDLGRQEHIWGYGSSPVLAGDLCLLNFGPGDRSFLIAVEKKTGKEVWRHDVPPPDVWEGNGAAQKYSGSWSTPVIVKDAGRTVLLAAMPGALRTFSLTDGAELWHCNGMNPLSYANPLQAGDIFVGMGGFGGWAIGVRGGGTGDVTATHRLWQEKRNSQRIGSGVVHEELIYMADEPGVVQCIDPQTGQSLWKERVQVPNGRASTWSSLVLCGDLIYMVTQGADTVLLRAGRAFEQVRVNSLGDGLCNASPAISGGRIFLRTHQHLWCIGAAAQK